MMKELFTRLRFLVRRRPQSELDEELRFHLEQAIEANLAAGMTVAEARRQALVEFGGVERTREQCYEQRPGWWLGTVAQDVRYALRGFRRNPVFVVTVIATLAVGIGATTAVFSVIDRILFRALPYAEDEQLVSFGLSQSLESQEFTLGGFFYEWRDNQKPFEQVTFEQGTWPCDLTEGNPVRLSCAAVAANFLPTLGMTPALGRNFLPEEDLPNGPKVAMISDGIWQSRYNRDPGVVEKRLEIDGKPVRIVGVLPRNFEMPRMQAADVVMPAAMDVAAQHTVNSGIGAPMWAFARLKPGISVAEAKAEMEPLFLHTQQWIPAEIRKDFHLEVRSIRDRQMQDAYAAAWVLLGGVLAVLLIACANVASLFSARGAGRARELAVRSALGASRGRLIRQTMTEAMLLALAGAGLGLALAEGLVAVFVAMAPSGMPFLSKARLDLRMVVFTVCIAVVCAAVFGILSALEKPRAEALAARQTRSSTQGRFRRLLVTAQIVIGVVLLSSAALLVRSFHNLVEQGLGMETGGVMTVRIPVNDSRYPTDQACMDFYLRAEAALRRVPGVSAVGISDSLPPDGWHSDIRYPDLFVPGKPRTPPGLGGNVVRRVVTGDYFRVLKIPIEAGRDFSEEERTSSGSAMILSKMLAEKLFPQENAIGQHIQIADYRPYFVLDGPVYTVVGVAGNVKNGGLAGEDDPEYYTLRRSRAEDWNRHTVLEVETSLPAAVVAPWVRSQIAGIDRTVPVEMETMRQTVSKLADRPRFEASLVGFFALCGLAMSVIGLYGLISFLAAQRTQEIGVRMALGATRGDILRLIGGEGVRLIVVGGAIGVVAAVGVAQLLKSLLFHVGPNDPAAYVGGVAVLGLVALAATLIPARRAMRVEPVEALRYE